MKRLLLILLLICSISARSQYWSDVDLNTTENLNDVFCLDNGYGWIVGDTGLIFHYMDNEWQELDNPVTENINAVYLLDSTNIWLVGDNGLIVNYFSGLFNEFTGLTNEDLNDIHMLDSSSGWIVGNHGTLLKYQDGIWEHDTILNNPLDDDLEQIDMLDPTYGIIVGFMGARLEYENGWYNMTDMNTIHFRAICILDSNRALVSRWQGTPLDNWHDIGYYPWGTSLFSNGETVAPVTSIDIEGDYGWAVSYAREILKYNGDQFELVQSSTFALSSVSIVDDTTGWIVGYNGTLLSLNNTTSVDDHHLQDNLRVFPNPCTNTIHVEVKLNEINRIDIYNTSGIKLISQTYSPAEKTLAVIGLENLVPGIYIMDIVSGNSHSITKFVKR